MAKRDVWKDREGHPGYFVTEDSTKQMLMTPSGSFAICEMAETNGGHRVIRGPSRDPAKLGIPQHLLDEAEELTVADIIRQAEAARAVAIRVTPLPASAD